MSKNSKPLKGKVLLVLLTAMAVSNVSSNEQLSDAGLAHMFGATEITVQESSVGSKDTDGDGVFDTLDNCTWVVNPDQIDIDGDQFGNRCDPDFDNNCVVNFLEVIRYKNAFNSAVGDPNYDPLLDLDSSGSIGFIDYISITATFLREPGPSTIECVPDD